MARLGRKRTRTEQGLQGDFGKAKLGGAGNKRGGLINLNEGPKKKDKKKNKPAKKRVTQTARLRIGSEAAV